MARSTSHAGRTTFLALVLACILLGPEAALGQDASGQDASGLGDDARGRVPMFEVLERTEAAEDGASGARIAVAVETQANETPEIVLIGPGGRIDTRRGTASVFEDLPPGTYLLAATAPGLRLAYGTLRAEDGEAVHTVLRLFNLRRYYADEAGTWILGMFKMDVADNVAEGFGTLELRTRPAGRMVVLGGDGVVMVRGAEDAHTVEGLEVGPYVIAVTAEDHRLAVASIVVTEDVSTMLDVELEAGQPE